MDVQTIMAFNPAMMIILRKIDNKHFHLRKECSRAPLLRLVTQKLVKQRRANDTPLSSPQSFNNKKKLEEVTLFVVVSPNGGLHPHHIPQTPSYL